VLLRRAGSDAALAVRLADLATMQADFAGQHLRRFGFGSPDQVLVAEAVLVEAEAIAETFETPLLPARGETPLVAIDEVSIWHDGAAHRSRVLRRDDLRAGDVIDGPALIAEAIGTIFIAPGWRAGMGGGGEIVLDRVAARAAGTGRCDDTAPDPVRLEMFANLFMHVAEQCGLVLRQTARSVNIRERLDFSCAIFDATGGLVANAPHVPVHLGAMGESVRHILKKRAGMLRPGDVIALNDPYAGGTHLPDITVLTPVFGPDGRTLRFWMGARGHHADIGGATPGSTPPDSRSLDEEGVVIDDFLIVSEGRLREAEFCDLLAGARFPARSPDTNVADLVAQIAANANGVAALETIVAHHGWEVVCAYLGHVQDNAEARIRQVIDRLTDGRIVYPMDDGRELHVAVSIDREARRARIDFTGTSAQDEGNFNAPPAVTRAVVLYVFRCLVGADIPLNEGCLRPLEIVIPEGSFLAPLPGAAVVAGNTEISQAVCNALFLALGALACSQGTMNNLLFGDATRQYYETICGGAGAGPGFDGASAVQTHMTNTRMTDPEVMELRYPVRVEEFSIRRGSGGDGLHRGGDGAVRRLRFLEPMTAVVVASRRT
ncbi:hydantoinase B/oxoprolinase family protein, partial [Endobacter medicaginis]